MTPASPQRPLRNPQRFIANVLWLIVAGCGMVSLIVLPFGEPVSRVWPAGAIAGGLMLIPALICEFIMIPRVERRLRAFRNGQFLVHWLYSSEEWERWRELCHSRWEKRLREPVGEAFIDRDGVYFDGSYESWTLSFNYWLEKVELQQGRPDWLEIYYCWTSGHHIGRSLVRVPVPANESEKADQVLTELQSLARPRN